MLYHLDGIGSQTFATSDGKVFSRLPVKAVLVVEPVKAHSGRLVGDPRNDGDINP